MTPPILDEGALLAVTDTREGTAAWRCMADQYPGRRLGIFLALSLALHIMTAAAALGFSYLHDGWGRSEASEPPVLFVSLTEGISHNHLEDAGQTGETMMKEAKVTVDRKMSTEKTNPHGETPVVFSPDPKVLPEKPEPWNISSAPKAGNQPQNSSQEEGHQRTAAGPVWWGDGGQAGLAGSGVGAGTDQKGTGEAASTSGYIKGNYDYIKKRIRQHLVYSPQAKRMGIQGTVTISFAIERDGRARNIAVINTSGSDALDESAVKAVRNASPFPLPPETARIIIPISFSLK